MRVFGKDCGCDSRREIMFTSGELGVQEAAFVAVIVIVVGLSVRHIRKG